MKAQLPKTGGQSASLGLLFYNDVATAPNFAELHGAQLTHCSIAWLWGSALCPLRADVYHMQIRALSEHICSHRVTFTPHDERFLIP